MGAAAPWPPRRYMPPVRRVVLYSRRGAAFRRARRIIRAPPPGAALRVRGCRRHRERRPELETDRSRSDRGRRGSRSRSTAYFARPFASESLAEADSRMPYHPAGASADPRAPRATPDLPAGASRDRRDGATTVSSEAIAEATGVNSAKVRKDSRNSARTGPGVGTRRVPSIDPARAQPHAAWTSECRIGT